MTARPPAPLHDDALSAEEREVAARLAKLDAAAGPSAALDARILAAAGAAARARTAPRWPRAVGAAAVLVAAVGLAWQLKPMFALPPPPVPTEHAGTGASPGAESEVVVRVEPVPRVTAMAPAATGQMPAQAAAPAAARKAAPAAGGAPVVAQARAVPQPSQRAPERRAGDFVDEAMPPPAPAPLAAAAPVASPRALDAAGPAAANERTQDSSGTAARASAPADFGDIRSDAQLPLAGWLARIRARRDGGDLDGARASLARFVATHPRARVPNDLQPLLHDADPWEQ